MKIFLLFILLLQTYLFSENIQWEYCKGLDSDYDPSSCIVAHKNLILAGAFFIWVSYDNGSNWSRLNIHFSKNAISSILSYDNKYLFATAKEGIYFSSDDGNNWIKRDSGVSPLSAYCLAKSGNKIFAGTDSGLYVSEDLGLSWYQTTSSFEHERVLKIETKDENVLVKTSNLYLSSDSGISWNRLDLKLSDEYISTFTFLKKRIIVGTSEHIYISSNLGESWDIISDSIPDDLFTSIVTNDDVIFAGTYRDGIYFSSDLGKSWTKARGRPVMINFLSICDDYIFAETYGSGTWRAKLSDFGNTNTYEEIENEVISITPNPATDYIEINNVILNEVKDPVVKIYDVLGNVVVLLGDSRFRGNDIWDSDEGEIIRIDVSSLSPGIYFVQVGNKLSKFIKVE